MVTKTCTSCKTAKPASEFYKKTATRYHSRCKLCMNEYRKKRYSVTREIERKVNADYYKKNGDYWRTQHREYYKENKQKAADRAKKRRARPDNKPKEALYRMRSRKRIREYAFSRYRKDIDRSRAEGRAAYRKYKANWIIQNHKRRARTSETFIAAEWGQIKKRYGNRCLRCGCDDPLTMDHVIPISLGGRNIADNIQPLCKKCNRWKWNRAIDYRPNHDKRPRSILGVQEVQPTPIREFSP